MTDKAREDRARAKLRRQGYRVIADRVRKPNFDHQGGYKLLDADEMVVAGERYDLSLDDLEKWAHEEETLSLDDPEKWVDGDEDTEQDLEYLSKRLGVTVKRIEKLGKHTIIVTGGEPTEAKE